jgi:uncharacterized membrane protein
MTIFLIFTFGLIYIGIDGFNSLKKDNYQFELISVRKQIIWSILSLVLALVNIVCLIYTYFSDFNS